MIESSNDLLNIILAVAVVWITVFVCWPLYYVIRTIHDLRSITKNMSHTSTLFIEFLDELKDKLVIAATSSQVISKATTELVDHVADALGKKKKATKKPRAKKPKIHS